MKIVYVNTLYYPNVLGGAEYSLKLIVEGMQKRGYNVSVICTSDKPGIYEELVEGIKVYRVGIENVYWHYSSDKKTKLKKLLWHTKDIYNRDMRQYISQIIEKEKPDFISCHNLAGFSVSVWDEFYKYNIPIIQVLHDLYLLCINSNMFKNGESCKQQCKICSFFRLIHKKKSKKIFKVVGISQFILNKLLYNEYFINASTYVIHNVRTISNNHREFWDGTRTFKIGFIGTLYPHKGIEWLINSFMSLNINANLIVAGKSKDNYGVYLKKVTKKDERIIFLGEVDSQDFYKQVDLVVMPSLWEEPLGMVAVEACANSIPVITTNRGGLPEIIKNGVNGIIVNPDEISSLKEAILTLYNDFVLFRELASKARNSVEDFLDKERMLNEYEKVIKDV